MDGELTCFIEFRVYDETRFQLFERFLRGMRARSLAAAQPVAVPEDSTQRSRSFTAPEDWLLLFRPDDLLRMGLPDHTAALAALQAWKGLTRNERRAAIHKDEALQLLADFADMVKRLSDVRYRPTRCEKNGRDTARLEFVTDELYFTERDSLEDLLLFFGFMHIVDDGC
ncbi:MAG: hypothetical protein MUE40_04410 [Anaerolineae bacterium]|jgi:hypothetical protein|nr:hypothetical protein [Anaerolineae bacterium]